MKNVPTTPKPTKEECIRRAAEALNRMAPLPVRPAQPAPAPKAGAA